MRFAYNPCMPDPQLYIPLAKTVEENGFDAISLPDSVCYPKIADTKYPYNGDGSRNFLENMPFLDPFTAIAAMSAVTENLHFTTSVLKTPIRNPVLLAKQISSLAVLCNERISLGLGLSPWIEDFEICNEPWPKRGKRMDEMLTIIRRLMTGEYYGHDSEFYQIPECKICPVPNNQVPLLIGGHAEAALKRAARVGDGWIHAGGDIATLTPLISRLKEFREEYGVADKPFQIHAITADAFSVDGVKKLEELGVTECIVGFRNAYNGQPDTASLEQKETEIKWFADTIISKL
ncbi:alkanesulfonate monooxygenase SsuD/methylene tetrahydromethanopterin reductase-like flavin-dependent oxidoreductase (luciferase family) [Sinobacterium caligoides]|uniref:Alkanesulfonate monooxygenase SsuD/methylene tetrahydromethanopterin reductase-like flavin-dependent oxidoreductase (Luciferase family) n=1 Tax=Sinobacterium caligoides TaxID=933926 RepID=A0A3N2DYN7_9GAMM|nr:LLM class flavin-dependent oxidoreductase [Sinobacterium caligoides]ROS04963.1 alkanesulfonate monooxygenase SsuD/methylene tetrahydromethanopterin reductase-like flavin-dependent oxidoreductase (luciferase family) [Sinobacterium caligoides]